MNAILCAFLIILCLVCICLFAMLGMDYYIVGRGLHPALATFGVASGAGVGAWAMGLLAEMCGE